MRTVIVALTLLMSFSPVGAEMYKWVDENGAVTFKDTPPAGSAKGRKVKVYKESDFAAAPPSQPVTRTEGRATAAANPAGGAKNERFSGTVEIYVTEWCGYCKRAQSYMTSRGIPFVAYDIEKDRDAKRRYRELGGRGVPLIIIGSNKMSGFAAETLEYYLNNSR